MTGTEHEVRRVARKWAQLTARAAQEVRENVLRGSSAEAEPWVQAARKMYASLGLSHAGATAEQLAGLVAQQWVFEAVHRSPSSENDFDLQGVLAARETSGVFSSNTALAFRRAVEAAPLDAWQAYHEQFLAEYSPALRKRSGSYFTPAAAIGYLVRSVDDLLREQFSAPNGLGDLFAPADSTPLRERRLMAVDPACGVGGFLLGAMQWARANGHQVDTFPDALLGFEIAPQTCLAARSLSSYGGGRRVLCLDPLACPPEELPLLGDWIQAAGTHAHSHGQPPILIVFANPPYSNFGSHAGGRWISQELNEYKRGLGEKKTNLDDDYIRFLRWGQICLDRVGAGILAYVTSNTFLSGITHRRMRESLLESFDELYVLNLHGGAKHKRQSGGAIDENIFAIQQGVALHLFVKRPAGGQPKKTRRLGRLHLAEIRGQRAEKIRILSEASLKTTVWREESPAPDYFFFQSRPRTPRPEYQQGVPLNEVFGEYVSGVQTKNDRVFVGRTRAEVQEKVIAFLAMQKEPREFSPSCLRRYITAPFDQRWVYYEPTLLGRARLKVMRHMLPNNLGLVFMRQSANDGEYDHFLAVDALVSDRVFYSAHGAAFLAPLYLKDAEQNAREGEQGRTNFNHAWLQEFASRIQRTLLLVGRGDFTENFGPEDVFAFLYAAFHSKSYRANNADLLRREFPRAPWPSSAAQFQTLSTLGQRLVALHCFPSPLPSTCTLQGAGDGRIGRGFPKFEPVGDNQPGKIAINPTQAFTDVAPDDWQWRVGGYSVLRHWLKARRGCGLPAEEIATFQQLLGICQQSRRLAQQIEQALSKE